MERVSRSLLVSFALVLSACFTPVSEGPPVGYERTLDACTNRFDDDGDRLLDCRDPDCIRQGFCNRRIPVVPFLEPENTPEKCTDFIDNDDDGRFDCGDSDCFVMLELCCSIEFDDVACSNGIDDDGNGFADCQDSGCSRNPFVTVCEVETDCSNNIDDDGDRRPDCLDQDCEEAVECHRGETSCNDGDDDRDGAADCDDPDCRGTAACVPGGEQACDDGDDDGDGRADCDDFDCYLDFACRGPENTLARCVDRNNNDGSRIPRPGGMGTIPALDCNDPTCASLTGDDLVSFTAYCEALRGEETSLDRCQDGSDNDGNGFTDCNDFSCSRSGSPEAIAFCATLVENDLPGCSDGVDNDRDNFTDCEDFSCSDAARGATPAAVEFCASSMGEENSLEACSDGVDNDDNGFIDCNDFACTDTMRGATPEAIAYCDELEEASLEECSNGLDDDGDGFADCADFSCSRSEDVDVARACVTLTERSFTLCTDGLDNDGNGFGDCQDFSCRSVIEAFVDHDASGDLVPNGFQRSPCQESVGAMPEFARANCMDGRDNDDDGFVDCEDWDCNWNPVTRDLCEVTFPPELMLEPRPQVCG